MSFIKWCLYDWKCPCGEVGTLTYQSYNTETKLYVYKCIKCGRIRDFEPQDARSELKKDR